MRVVAVAILALGLLPACERGDNTTTSTKGEKGEKTDQAAMNRQTPTDRATTTAATPSPTAESADTARVVATAQATAAVQPPASAEPATTRVAASQDPPKGTEAVPAPTGAVPYPCTGSQVALKEGNAFHCVTVCRGDSDCPKGRCDAKGTMLDRNGMLSSNGMYCSASRPRI